MQKRFFRFIRIQWKMLKRLRGDRRAIARGTALGISANFIPTFGVGVPIVYWIAGIIRGHRSAAVVSTIGFKPLLPLLFLLNYVIGEVIITRQLITNIEWYGALHAGRSFLLGMVINFSIAYFVVYYFTLHWTEKKKMKNLNNR